MQRKISRLLLCVIAVAGAFLLLRAPVLAAEGPFTNLAGNWSGTGTLRPSNSAPERIRCSAHYRPIGQHELNLQLRCDSDSYHFDLSADAMIDERDHMSGSWFERTRGVSGTVVGNARGERMLVRAASPGFTADLVMVTRGSRQNVSLNSEAAGTTFKGSMMLKRQ